MTPSTPSSSRTADLACAAGLVRFQHAGDGLFEHVRGFRWRGVAPEGATAEVWLRPGHARFDVPDRAVRVGYTSTVHTYELAGRSSVIWPDVCLIGLDYGARELTVDYRAQAEGQVRGLLERALTSLLVAMAHERGSWFLEASAWSVDGRTLLFVGEAGCGREAVVDWLRDMGRGELVTAPVLVDRSGAVHPFVVPLAGFAAPGRASGAPWPHGVDALIWVARWKAERSLLKLLRPHVMAERVSEPTRRHLLLPHSRRWRDYTVRPQLRGLRCNELRLGSDWAHAEAVLLGAETPSRERP